MNIVIIGTGNTATVLGRKFKTAGHHIIQVFGRNGKSAADLAYDLDSVSTNYWALVNRNADLYILAVSDTAIEEVVKELQLPEKTIVHTAASVSKSILENKARHFGVFYPLQSLKKELSHFPDTPIIIDASDPDTLHLLEALANTISNIVVQVNDEDRLKLHLAAVFCNNFVNHLYALMESYCQKENLDFKLLIPLINETSSRLSEHNASGAQTGPAIRNDFVTIEKHLQLLAAHPQLNNIYTVFTKSIQEQL